MAISLVGTESSAGTGTTAVTPVPAGVQADDFMVWCQSNQNATVLTAPAGWTQIEEGAGTAHAFHTMWRRATGSEPADYSNTMPSGRSCSIMALFRGVHLTTPFDVATP